MSIKLSNLFQSKTLMINWEQILDSLKTLKNCGFRARAIVSENHSAKVLAYKLLLKETGHLDDHLFIQHDYQKIYWLYDVHLIKNVRNNLLSYKRFIFPALNTMVLKTILFKGGQTSWKLYHNVLKKIAHLRLTWEKLQSNTSTSPR